VKPKDIMRALRPGPLSLQEQRIEALRCAVDSRLPNMSTEQLLARAGKFQAFIADGDLPPADGAEGQE
jgi:hypothetical protein